MERHDKRLTEHFCLDEFTYSGIAVISPEMFQNLPDGKRPLAPLLKDAMLQGRVAAGKLSAAWVDVGTPERLADLDRQIRQG